ncbi:MAG: hypothetical protein WA971_02070 [Microbacterium sp.]
MSTEPEEQITEVIPDAAADAADPWTAAPLAAAGTTSPPMGYEPPTAEALPPFADPDAADIPAAEPMEPLAPRTRWAGIVWGLFFAVLALAGVWQLSDPDRIDDVTTWIGALSPGTMVAVALLAIGVLVLIAGLAGLIRHAQRKLAR